MFLMPVLFAFSAGQWDRDRWAGSLVPSVGSCCPAPIPGPAHWLRSHWFSQLPPSPPHTGFCPRPASGTALIRVSDPVSDQPPLLAWGFQFQNWETPGQTGAVGYATNGFLLAKFKDASQSLTTVTSSLLRIPRSSSTPSLLSWLQS